MYIVKIKRKFANFFYFHLVISNTPTKKAEKSSLIKRHNETKETLKVNEGINVNKNRIFFFDL